MKLLHTKSLLSIVLLVVGIPAVLAADRSVALVVEGMDCAACPIMVRASLERIDGVKVTHVDVKTSTMRVAVFNDAISDANLIEATANAGYKSRIGNNSR